MLPAVLLCLVVGITDGDTLRGRCDDQTMTIRLAEIDAPEKGQPFSNRSRQSLAALCFRRSAQLRPVSIDRYGRTVAHVDCAGIDAGTAQVKVGMAWVLVRYAPGGSDLYRVESEARAGHVGLWSDPHALAPWCGESGSVRVPSVAEGFTHRLPGRLPRGQRRH